MKTAFLAILLLFLPCFADEVLNISVMYKLTDDLPYTNMACAVGGFNLDTNATMPYFRLDIASNYVGFSTSTDNTNWLMLIQNGWIGADTMPTNPPGPFFVLQIDKAFRPVPPVLRVLVGN